MIEEPIYNRFSRHLLQTAYSNHYENYAVCPVGVLFVLTTLLGSNGIRQNTARQVKYALKIQRNENSSARQRAKNLYLF
ncbi:unnamed protein product [Heterobilharzia americana]|nr:unnamed protein product [Heterobilharzia americana]